MPRPLSHPVRLEIPRDLDDLTALPQYGTADLCAEIHTQFFGPISPRTIRERWGLDWRVINGRAVTDIPIFVAEAQCRFDAAPIVTGARGEPPAAPATAA
jgi:hypothetical protein